MIPWDKLKEECGVFAIVSHPEAARLAYLGIYALQHRGQESAGIVSSDGKKLHLQRGMGHVADVFNETSLEQLPGAFRHRARALFDGGRKRRDERSTDSNRLLAWSYCTGAQREPDQCCPAPTRARTRWCHFPFDK